MREYYDKKINKINNKKNVVVTIPVINLPEDTTENMKIYACSLSMIE